MADRFFTLDKSRRVALAAHGVTKALFAKPGHGYRMGIKPNLIELLTKSQQPAAQRDPFELSLLVSRRRASRSGATAHRDRYSINTRLIGCHWSRGRLSVLRSGGAKGDQPEVTYW